jgi:thiol-disulfide isomerase/thioredoxin
VLITGAFAVGVALPLFVLAVLGQRVLTKTRVLAPYTKRIQQVFGLIMLLAAGAIYTGYDKVLQTRLLDSFPHYERFLNGLERNDAVRQQLDELNKSDSGSIRQETETPKPNVGSDVSRGEPAPEFAGIERWLNTEGPLSMQDLRGRVVLVDFWTYSCINCIRTRPYMVRWYERYKDQGLVVVGVHTPEFPFEKKTANVMDALSRYQINYPVAQDNDFVTWRAYNNQYWPARYLIDAEGGIRYTHFGEGQYEETEMAIQALLKETL